MQIALARCAASNEGHSDRLPLTIRITLVRALISIGSELAFKPAFVMTSAIPRPSSPCRHTGIPDFARTSHNNLRATRLVPMFIAAAFIIRAGKTGTPSSGPLRPKEPRAMNP